MSKFNIAIVNSSSFGKWFPSHLKRLETIGHVGHFTVPSSITGKDLADKLTGFNIIISSVTPTFSREFFENSEEVVLISRHGIGYNNVDIEAADEKGTIVTIVPPLVERNAVAENAVANLLAIMRLTVGAQAAAKENNWQERATFVGNDLTGKTVGVIGCGNIGSRVAEILRHGFNTRLLVNDPAINTTWAKKHGGEIVDLPTLLKESDVISLNASLNDSSFEMLSDPEFDLMKKGIYITNTARGALLDESAVVRALDKKIIKGLAVDVMVEEPAVNSHPFFSYENVLVTPHTSAYTIECLEGMGEKCVDDVESVVANLQPKSMVMKQVLN